MAVLVEGISVIIRADRLLAAFDDDSEAFKAIVPNKTLCADGELVRVGFMSPREARDFVNQLAEFGQYVVDGHAQDLTVVDQQRGPATATSWAEFGRIEYRGDPAKRVAVGRLIGSKVKQMVAPDWWSYEDSLTSSYLFLETSKTGWGEG